MKYNRFLRESLTRGQAGKPGDAAVDEPKATPEPAEVTESAQEPGLGQRQKIGLLDTEPKRIGHTPEGLTPQQQALREAVINRFTVNKVNRYITEQIEHINYKHQLAAGIRQLFDEHGRPPANAPLESIIAARKKMESDIKMLEAICFSMRNHLSKIKEIEEMAIESMQGPNRR